MRILHVVHSFPPDSRGGTETYVQAIAAEQQREGHGVAVLAGCDERRFEEARRVERVDGLEVTRLRAPARDLSRLAGIDADLREAFLATLAEGGFDAVHLHHWHNLSTDLVSAARARGVPSVVTLHDYFATCPFFFRLPDGETPCPPDLERATCVRCVGRIAGDAPQVLDAALAEREGHLRRELLEARAVVVLSRAQAEFLRAYPPFADVRYDVLSLPAPTWPARPPLQDDATAPEPRAELNVVSWGGLEKPKGLGTLVAAVAGLARPERVAVHHFGRVLDEAYRGRLEAEARGPLKLHGAFDPVRLTEFAAFDLAVFPSLFLETHGYVVDEALALGLPVVVSDRGAPQERIGERGVVVPAGDAAALRGVLERALDDERWLADRRAAAAPERSDLTAHVRELLGLYRR